ncbi:MAG: GNAT family N-acetyltransferase [Colwellia sp.]|jgi:hypothetical protein
MTKVERYRELCESESSIPIFSQPWWLDATCGNRWDVCLVEGANGMLASMPYVIKSHYGFVELSQSPLTQKLGPWLKPSSAKRGKVLGQQKKLLSKLISQLPKYDYFNQKWDCSYTNWLPFYWLGFSQTTRITYQLSNLGDLNAVWEGLQSNIKGDVRKALKHNVKLKENPTIEEFIELNKKVFARQQKSLPYSEELVRIIDRACLQHQRGKLFVVADDKGHNHAAVYLIWDENSAYYLMGGGDADLRNSGATSLCLWEAIKFASTVTKKFDFEGSMIEPVEKFFKAFGAEQVLYHAISKSNSKILDLLMLIKSWSRRS